MIENTRHPNQTSVCGGNKPCRLVDRINAKTVYVRVRLLLHKLLQTRVLVLLRPRSAAPDMQAPHVPGPTLPFNDELDCNSKRGFVSPTHQKIQGTNAVGNSCQWFEPEKNPRTVVPQCNVPSKFPYLHLQSYGRARKFDGDEHKRAG